MFAKLKPLVSKFVETDVSLESLSWYYRYYVRFKMAQLKHHLNLRMIR